MGADGFALVESIPGGDGDAEEDEVEAKQGRAPRKRNPVERQDEQFRAENDEQGEDRQNRESVFELRARGETRDHSRADDESQDNQRGKPNIEQGQDGERNGCDCPNADERLARFIFFGQKMERRADP